MTLYPDFLKAQIRSSKQPVFAQDYTPAHIDDCENCGGVGSVYVFFTERGPFRDVPGTGRNADSVLKSIADEMYGWVWYIGKLVGAVCPVCKGNGKQLRQVAIHQFNTGQPVKQLAEQMGK